MRMHFIHHDEHTWLSLQTREDGLIWYRIERLSKDGLLVKGQADPNDIELLGFARWEPGETHALNPDGTPANEALANRLTQRLDSARDAGLLKG